VSRGVLAGSGGVRTCVTNSFIASTYALADRGFVLTGVVVACRPAGAGWEADLRVGEATITCRLPDKPPTPGDEFAITVLEPPYFASDGSAILSTPTEGSMAKDHTTSSGSRAH
jgi:hypothetical protein